MTETIQRPVDINRQSSYEESENHQPASKQSPTVSHVSIVNETGSNVRYSYKSSSKNSLNRSQELRQKQLAQSSKIMNITTTNERHSKIHLIGKICFFVSLTLICLGVSIGVCLIVVQAKDVSTLTSNFKFSVFLLDQQTLFANANYSQAFRIPFLDTKCDFLTLDSKRSTFEVTKPGTFELSLSIALTLNDSVGRSARVCLNYASAKPEVCNKISVVSQTVMNLGLQDIANLDTNDIIYVKINSKDNVVVDKSLTRLIVKRHSS